MKNTIKLWKDCGHHIVLQDIQGGQFDGWINSFDDIGVAIQLCKKDVNSVKLFPWTSILKIEKC